MLSLMIASGVAAHEVPMGAKGKIPPNLFADGLAQSAVLASLLSTTGITQIQRA